MRFRCKIALVIICALALTFAISFLAFADSGSVALSNESFTSSLGIVKVANASNLDQTALKLKKGADGGGYAMFYPTNTGTNPAHGFVEVNYPNTYVSATDNVRYFILEFDFTTETQYVDGMEFEFIGKDAAAKSVFGQTKTYISNDSEGDWTIKTVNSKKIEQERGVWQHITLIIDVSRNNASGSGSVNSMLYTYLNGEFIGSGKAFKGDLSYLHSLRISYPNKIAVDISDTFCFDNLKVTKLTDSYSGNLSAVLADKTKSLTTFDLSNYKSGYTFPKTAAVAKIGDTDYSTVSDIENALKIGDELVVLADIYDTLKIPCECSIYNPNGYDLTYDANGFTAYESEDTVSFIEPFDSIEVIWHIGDRIEKATYTSAALAVPPSYSETVEINGVVCKAIGFAKSEGGAVASDLGYVSPYNREFWLVYEEPVALSMHSDGTVSYAYSDSEFESFISSAHSKDIVKLLCDVTVSSAFNVNSKELTVDLGGYTLNMSENITSDMFTVGTGGKLTFKNGTVDAYRNGRIPQGSTSIARRRLFVTSAESSELVAENLTVNASKMIALIKSGTATFSKCNIDFTNDYENMIDLYANNSSVYPSTLNFNECNIVGYKTIVNVFKPSNVSNNNAVINATNCYMKTAERVFATEAAGAVSITGGKYDCKYLFGKLNTNKNATVTISEGTLMNFDLIDEKGGLNFELDGGEIVRINNKEYPYTVSKSYVNIKWVWPDKTVNELWKKGETPVCPFKIPENTGGIKYEIPEIKPVSGAAEYKLTMSENFNTRVSMELGCDFSLNLYISEMDFKTVKIGSVSYTKDMAKVVLLNGETYYKFNTGTINPDKCVKTLNATITLPSAFGEKQYVCELNVLRYLEKILTGGYDYETHRLALTALATIGSRLTEEGSIILFERTASKYDLDSVILPIEESGADISAVSDALAYAYISGENGIAYRLVLNPEYSGTLTVTYTLFSVEHRDELEVVQGKCDGKDYIEIHTDSDALAKGIAVTAEDTVTKVDMSLVSKQSEGIIGEDLMILYSYSKQVERYLAESEEA